MSLTGDASVPWSSDKHLSDDSFFMCRLIMETICGIYIIEGTLFPSLSFFLSIVLCSTLNLFLYFFVLFLPSGSFMEGV